MSNHPGRWWHRLDDGRIQCDLCPRDCRLHEGQRGMCFVRARENDAIVLTTYGRSSGFCIDPVEKKPLNHFLPGAAALSFGTAGCNLSCDFCQNWDISKSREVETLSEDATRETSVWFEITTLLIPGKNDSDEELRAMSAWIMKELGPDVPLHFSAFHPDFRMLDVPHTPPETLRRARRIALEAGLHFVYVGNVHDEEGSSTYCHQCGEKLVGRDWYVLTKWNLTASGACRKCGAVVPGHFEAKPGTWGARRQMVNMRAFA